MIRNYEDERVMMNNKKMMYKQKLTFKISVE